MKPSAIFKINNNHQSSAATYDLEDSVMEDSGKLVEQYDITIGISIEPAETVEALLLAQKQSRGGNGHGVPSDSQGIAVLANKIVQNAYNFLSGFTGADGRVPMKAFDEWWNKFKSRINANPNYLDGLE